MKLINAKAYDNIIEIINKIAAGETGVKIEAEAKDNLGDLLQPLAKIAERMAWYESIIDAVPFPIHVTDNDMNWTYMNKAFETLMIGQGVVRERKDGYGKACCNAGANICNTKDCGIKQLLKGKPDSYFDWCGMSCKQDTSYLKNKKGETVGFVEVVTDLTSILKVNAYTKVEVDRLAINLDLLAHGNLELDLNVTESDEFTKDTKESFVQINNNLTKVKKALELLTEDAEMLAEAAVNGDLKTRVDASKHEGEYRSIIKGINSTLDAVIVPLSYAAGYIEKMSNGEDLEIIDKDYKGDFKVLTDNLNKVRESLYALIDESVTLATAATEGKISVRGNVNRLKGGYGVVVKGINDLLDAIEGPLSESEAVMTKMAINDYTTQMNGQYKGTFAEFAHIINMVRERLLSVQDAFERVSVGDTSRLSEFEKVGKRSENDKIMPACTGAMLAIRNVIDESNRLANAAINGDLGVRGNEDKYEGGYKEIIQGLNKTMQAVVEPLQEASLVMKEMTRGNLTTGIIGDYKGEYANFKNDLNATIASFNEVLNNIQESSVQVASGARQISNSAQLLSEGSTEQASSIEELTASMEQISVQTKQNATSADQANNLAMSAKTDAEKGNVQMKEMLKAMGEINESSTNISKIIKVIDEIAFQTNILALNAAVEAARAGQHGKGFAVVAEEVRNLAARSANAAKETTVLIEGSIKKVEDGTRIANDTAEALNKIVDGVAKAATLVADIAIASNEQATGISQVNQGIMQVADVTQTNSATSQESAAASEELSSQAELLNEMVGRFTLNNSSSSSRGTSQEISSDVIKMLDNMSGKKKTGKEIAAGASKKIILSSKEFGKY